MQQRRVLDGRVYGQLSLDEKCCGGDAALSVLRRLECRENEDEVKLWLKAKIRQTRRSREARADKAAEVRLETGLDRLNAGSVAGGSDAVNARASRVGLFGQPAWHFNSLPA